MNQQQTEELLTTKLTSFHGMESSLALRAGHWAHSGTLLPGLRMVVWTGHQCELVCRIPAGARRIWSLLRRPAQSSACLENNRFVPDAPGLYIAQADFCGWLRQVELVAAPPALLDRIGVVGATYDRVIVFRNIVRDPACTAQTIVDSLEGSNKTFGLDGALLGSRVAVNLNNYGRT